MSGYVVIVGNAHHVVGEFPYREDAEQFIEWSEDHGYDRYSHEIVQLDSYSIKRFLNWQDEQRDPQRRVVER